MHHHNNNQYANASVGTAQTVLFIQCCMLLKNYQHMQFNSYNYGDIYQSHHNLKGRHYNSATRQLSRKSLCKHNMESMSTIGHVLNYIPMYRIAAELCKSHSLGFTQVTTSDFLNRLIHHVDKQSAMGRLVFTWLCILLAIVLKGSKSCHNSIESSFIL